ncbi:MAG: YfcE family phosphodiesterase [Magnetococcales bacterium]|nr:YfcE family phosphodiesterase [Magnetococcales bacterium]
MLIGIISDTHDHVDNVRKAVDIFQKRGIKQVLHAGDTVSPSVVNLFAGLDLGIVYGNNDGETGRIAKKVDQIGGNLGGEVLVYGCEEGDIAVYHGTIPTFLSALVRCGDYRVVITGHTHQVVDRTEGGTRVLNPGTAHGFGGPATAMIYDTSLDQVELIRL